MAEIKETKISTSSLRAYVMIGVLALIWAYFHWATDSIFLTPTNLSNLATQMSVTAILAVGMLMVIVSGNIDLSVGSVLGFAGGIAALSMTTYELGLVPSIIFAIAVGVLIGVFQGALTAYLNIPAFIVTLGGLLAWRGAVKWLLGGYTIPVADDTFKALGNEYILPVGGWIIAGVAIAFLLLMAYRNARSIKDYGLGEANYTGEILKVLAPIAGVLLFIWAMNSYRGIPVPVMILLAVALFGAFITNSTTFGRYLYAIGGNADAARLSGIDNKRQVLKVYALLGALTGVAALIFTARVGSAAPDAGVLKELDAIAACVIGGASLVGGRGTVFGACLGALIMASLDNGMSLLNVRDFMQDIIKGSILVAAVGLDMSADAEIDLLARTIPQRYIWAAEHLDVQRDDHILEIGCGYGYSIPLICGKLISGHLTAIDRSAKMVDAAAKANLSHIAAKKAEIIHTDLLDFKSSGQDFDKIFLFNLNVFWMDPVNELDAIRKLLNSDGKLFVFHQPPPGHEPGEFVEAVTQNLIKNRFQPTETIISESEDVRSICIKARTVSPR